MRETWIKFLFLPLQTNNFYVTLLSVPIIKKTLLFHNKWLFASAECPLKTSFLWKLRNFFVDFPTRSTITFSILQLVTSCDDIIFSPPVCNPLLLNSDHFSVNFSVYPHPIRWLPLSLILPLLPIPLNLTTKNLIIVSWIQILLLLTGKLFSISFFQIWHVY